MKYTYFRVGYQVEQFWALYTHCARPGDLAGFSDIHLFKLGIKPMWEVYNNMM